MILVTDATSGVHTFAGDGDFHTEDLTNNLVVQTATRYVVFAEGKWMCAEKVAD